MIAQQGNFYCVTGLSTRTSFSWFLDLNLNTNINPGEPVENNVTNTVPVGQNGPLLANAFATSISGNIDAMAAKVTATVGPPANCFTILRGGSCVGGTNPGATCALNTDCPGGGSCSLPPIPELYVGPPGNPQNCHVTSSGCIYNPTITKVPSLFPVSVPTLNLWGLLGAVVAVVTASAFLLRRRHRTVLPNHGG